MSERPADSRPGERASYVLGHSPGELDRLARQAQVKDPITRRFAVEAGVGPGMRVLDVGSGAGDVALMLADLVGAGGEVVGFDRAEAGLEVARQKVADRALGNVSFVTGSIDEVDVGGPFDAVVGRYVLQFQAEPAELLAAVAARLKPGGVVVFHELDWAGVTATPAIPGFDELRDAMIAAVESSGASAHMGQSLPRTFTRAGLPDPDVRLESLVGYGARARRVLEQFGRLVGTLEPAIVAQGSLAPGELDLDGLADRLAGEAEQRGSLVRMHLEYGAWAQVG